ncbi:antiporter, partial [Thauera sp. WH-2]
FALQSLETPLWVFQLLALLSGIGGGNFACSMSNISTFFPRSQQGTALGLNAGLGNFGVTTMQVLIPLVMTVGLFGALAGDPIPLVKDSASLIGKITAGTPTYVQNAGFVWLLLLVPLAVIGWFGMNNLLTVSPNIGSTGAALGKIILFYGIALVVSAIGLYLYLPAPTGSGLLSGNGMWIVMVLVIVGTLYG